MSKTIRQNMREKKPKGWPGKGGPRYSGLGLAESIDAYNFKKIDKFLTRYGSVPSLITAPNGSVIAAYQYFDPKGEFLKLADGTSVLAYTTGMAITKSNDDGKTWSRYKRIKLKGLPKIVRFPMEPMIVLLEDGRMRVYFASRIGKITAYIFSAISSDYEYFDFEEGIRFMNERKSVPDPAIIKIGNLWHYYSPYENELVTDPNRNYHATSKDGLNFKREKDIVGVGDQFRGNALAVEGGYRFYTIGEQFSICSAFSKDGYEWVKEPGTRLKGNDSPHDASVTKLEDGTYLMAYVTKQLRNETFEG